MSLRVKRFSGPDVEWDDFARAQPDFTAFHLAAWKPLIENLYGHECPYLAARDATGGLRGVLPLVRVRSAIFGHFLVSMPFVNYGGPLGDREAVVALCEAASRLATEDSVKLLELRSRSELPITMPVSHRKITVLLDLPPDVDALRKHIGSKLRSQVKRPEKEGVVVRFGADQVDPFFEVFSRHMRDLGTPTQPRKLFREIKRRFGDDAWFGCAWLGETPIAAGAGFRFGTEFEMTWASSLYAYNKYSPNMLLYWEFMARAIGEGVTLFNFGRCSVDSGTHRFKRQWGSRDQPLFWYQHSRAANVGTPSPDDGAFSWGPKLWRHLPVPVASALGPRIVRFIP